MTTSTPDEERDAKGAAYAEALDNLLPPPWKGQVRRRQIALGHARDGMPTFASHYARAFLENISDMQRREDLLMQLAAVEMLIYGRMIQPYSPAEVKRKGGDMKVFFEEHQHGIYEPFDEPTQTWLRVIDDRRELMPMKNLRRRVKSTWLGGSGPEE